MKRGLFILFMTVLTMNMKSQNLLIDDTVSINEVLVRSNRPDGSTGFRKMEFAGTDLETISGASISDFISANTSLYIKDYGSGGLKSVSFRGMGPGHTTVLWEGLRIDNPMLGQSDFSLIPLMFIDKISLYFGGNPDTFGNRGSGGTINMSTQPEWGEDSQLVISTGLGSYGAYSEGISVSLGTENFNYRMRAFLNGARNEYSYTDNINYAEPVEKIRKGSAYRSRGLLQEVYVKNRNSIFEGKLWYNYNFRNLPGSIFISEIPGNENQLDESFKTIISYKTYREKFKIKGSAGLISDWLNYNNHLLDLDSRNRVNTLSANVEAEYKYSEDSGINIGLRSINSRVKTTNYSGEKGRDLLTMDLSINHVFSDLLGVHASIVQELNDFELIPPAPSVGFDLKPLKKSNFHLLGSIGRSNHLPGLNDLYWNPGGNPELLPEESLNGEIALSYENSKPVFQWSANITAYRSSINNMIVWVPITQWVWGPENISKVRSMGFEADGEIKISAGQSKLSLCSGYAYTGVRQPDNSSDGLVSYQLIYVPKHTAYTRILYSINAFYLVWNTEYTGIRYTSTDNTTLLPSYITHKLSVNYRKNLEHSGIVTEFTVINLFDKEYQSVAGYPLPGRSFNLSLKLNLNL